MFNKLPILLFFCLISISYSAVTLNFGTPIIPNECGSLGTNNPVEAKDCQTFKLTTGYCCYLTVTQDTIARTACIISPNNNPKKKAELINKYSYLNGDILIECPGNVLSFTQSYYMIFMFVFLIFMF